MTINAEKQPVFFPEYTGVSVTFYDFKHLSAQSYLGVLQGVSHIPGLVLFLCHHCNVSPGLLVC